MLYAFRMKTVLVTSETNLLTILCPTCLREFVCIYIESMVIVASLSRCRMLPGDGICVT